MTPWERGRPGRITLPTADGGPRAGAKRLGRPRSQGRTDVATATGPVLIDLDPASWDGYLDNAQWVQGVRSGSYRDWIARQYGERGLAAA